MSNYRRLISYIYAYEGGVKGKNIGFAKLEARNGQCRISVSVKKVYVGGNDLGVYLLSGNSEILLGKIFIRNGAGEFRTTVPASNISGSIRRMLRAHDSRCGKRLAVLYNDLGGCSGPCRPAGTG